MDPILCRGRARRRRPWPSSSALSEQVGGRVFVGEAKAATRRATIPFRWVPVAQPSLNNFGR